MGSSNAAACYCYIVECSDGTYYTGWAIDPEKRVSVHNKGRGAKYTRMRLPVRLVYIEAQPDRTTAMKREIAIKRLRRSEKLKLIEKKAVVRGGKGRNKKHTGRQVHRNGNKQA